MKGYFRRVQGELRGNPVEHRIEPSVDERALKKARSQLEAASESVAKARKKEADTTGAQAVAEKQLQTLRDKGITDAGRLAAAEERVAKAKRNTEAAQRSLNAAEGAQRSAGARVQRIEARFDGSQAERESASFFQRLVGAASSQGRAIGSTLGGAIGGALKGGLVGVAGAVTGVVAAAGKLGLDRLMGIDDARAKLKGLGHDVGSIETIMGSALASVKGTAFGLADAANVAASAVAAGIKPGEELTRYLKLTGDAAAIAGVGLDEMGSIFNKVQTNQKAYTDDLNQLADRGIPIYQWLQKELGVTAEALRDMVSNGEIDSATFQRVIEKNIGGAALSMGESVRGAFANVKAALGRLGAEALEPFFKQSVGVFGGLTTLIDGATAKVGPWADRIALGLQGAIDILTKGDFTAAFGNAFNVQEDAGIVDFLFDLREGFQRFIDEYGPRLSGVFFALRDAAVAAWPAVKDIVASLTTAFGAAGLTTWELLVQALEAIAPVLENVVIPALGTISGLMAENQGAVNTLLGGYLGFTAAGTAIDAVSGAFDTAKGAVEQVTGVIDQGKELYSTFTDATYGMAQAQTTLRGKMAALAGTIRGKAAADNISTAAAVRGMLADKARAGWTKIQTAATKVATAVQWAWNAALNANPIGLIIIAIAALVAGLVWFFTKTEVGKKLWDKIWDAMGKAVSWVWEKIIKPAWDGILIGLKAIGDFFQWVWENVLQPIWLGIRVAIGIVMVAFMLWWEATKLYVGFIWNVIKTAWETIIRPVFDALVWALGKVGEFFAWVWANVIKPAWDALGIGIAWVWNNVIRPTWDALQWALGALGTFFQWVWNSIIKPAWDALGAGISWVWNNIIKPTWDAMMWVLDLVGKAFSWAWNNVIKPVWDALGAGIAWVVDNIILPVWEKLKGALDLVRNAFDSAVKFIGDVWDKVKAITAKPVRFVVETVYNKGIREAWNKVAGWLKLPELPEANLGELGNYARGGRLPGYTPGRDVHDFYSPTGGHIGLSGGEGIARPEVVRAMGPRRWDELNKRAAQGGVGAVQRTLGNYALGGVVDKSLWNAVNIAFPNATLNSAYRPGDSGYHGKAQAIDIGGPMQQVADWIYRTYPGSAQLIYGPGPVIAEGNTDQGYARHYFRDDLAGHYDHVHWASRGPINAEGKMISGAVGSAGGGGFSIRGMIADMFDAVISPIGAAIPDFGDSDMGKVPRKAFETMKDGVRNFIMGKADEVDAAAGAVGLGAYGGNAETYVKEIIRAARDRGLGKEGSIIGTATAMVESNLRMYANNRVPASLGFPHEALSTDYDSVGLFQQRDNGAWGTVAERMNPYGSAALFYNAMVRKFPNWRNMDPGAVAQGVQVSAYPAKYGARMPEATNWVNRLFDDGGVANGNGFLLKKVIRPERVLSPSQTDVFENHIVPALDRFSSRGGMSQRDIDALQTIGGGAGEFVAQKIENQYVTDPRKNAREVRRASKRTLAETGLK